MKTVECFLQSRGLQEMENMDGLLELADLMRDLINDNRQAEIDRLLQYAMEHRLYEAFTWCMQLLQEGLEDPTCALQSFEFAIGRSIPGYDTFMERLQVEPQALDHGLETVCDQNGEVESFFNILLYKTGYQNIYLVSAENFDTKDNDYIHYQLQFVKNQIS